MSSRVRPAEPRDVAEMDAMVHELAAYERAAEAVEATPQDLAAALFGVSPRVHAHVVEVRDAATGSTTTGSTTTESPDGAGTDGGWTVAGMAVWYVTYSTWTGRHGLWLEDLYVRPAQRGAGLGRALLQALAAEAVAQGWRRMEWWVLDWNVSAHGVYRAVGAMPEDDWTVWRLAGNGLTDLAAGRRPAVESSGTAVGDGVEHP